MSEPQRKLRMGMVGGGKGAFIGAVHRIAACMHFEAMFMAGALSSKPQRAIESGRSLGLADDRNYPSWQEMLDAELELPPEDRIDFVSVVTPNRTHFEIANAFADAGFHVVIDKPMVCTSQEADALADTVAQRGVVLCVTYTYSGYPMVCQAREMVRNDELGTIRKIIVEYNQGWLARPLEQQGHKQASWRLDPAQAGLGGAIGDIGSHAEQLVRIITGLEIEHICADLTSFVEGRALDDDANVLLRFEGGARGMLTASQISTGEDNNLSIRIYGEKAGLHWRQEEPNQLIYMPDGEPQQVLSRGHGYLCESASTRAGLPPGHPEGLIEAFANIYHNAFAAMRAASAGGATDIGGRAFDYPDVIDGARGVRFIERVVESSHSHQKWLPFLPPGTGG